MDTLVDTAYMEQCVERRLRVDLPVHDPALLHDFELQWLPACRRGGLGTGF